MSKSKSSKPADAGDTNPVVDESAVEPAVEPAVAPQPKGDLSPRLPADHKPDKPKVIAEREYSDCIVRVYQDSTRVWKQREPLKGTK